MNPGSSCIQRFTVPRWTLATMQALVTLEELARALRKADWVRSTSLSVKNSLTVGVSPSCEFFAKRRGDPGSTGDSDSPMLKLDHTEGSVSSISVMRPRKHQQLYP